MGTEKPRVQTSRVSALTLSTPVMLEPLTVTRPVLLHRRPVLLSRPLQLPSTLWVLANPTQVRSRRREQSFMTRANRLTRLGMLLTVPTASLSAPQTPSRSRRIRRLLISLLVAALVALFRVPRCRRRLRKVAASPLATLCSLVMTLTRELTLRTLALPNPLMICRRLLCILTRVRRTLGLPIMVTSRPMSLRRVRVRPPISTKELRSLLEHRSPTALSISPLQPVSRALHLPSFVLTRVLVVLSRVPVLVSRMLTILSSPLPTVLTPLRLSRIRITWAIRLPVETPEMLFRCLTQGITALPMKLVSLQELSFLWSMVMATKVPTPRAHLTTEGAT